MTDNETLIIDAFAELPSDRREITLAACVAIDRVLGRREKKAREDFGSALGEDAREHPQLWVDAASLNRASNGTEMTLPVTRGTEEAQQMEASQAASPSAAWARAHENAAMRPAPVADADDLAF